jgi:hypothetical protein
MLEARLNEASVLKKLLECERLNIKSCYTRVADAFPIAIKELVTDANFECNEEGIVSSNLPGPPPKKVNNRTDPVCISCVAEPPSYGQLPRSPRIRQA